MELYHTLDIQLEPDEIEHCKCAKSILEDIEENTTNDELTDYFIDVGYHMGKQEIIDAINILSAILEKIPI